MRTSLDLLVLQPRSSQIVAQKGNPLVDNLLSIMSKYLKDVNVSHLTAEKVDPQFSFFTVTRANLQVFRLVYDNFVTLIIIIMHVCINNYYFNKNKYVLFTPF